MKKYFLDFKDRFNLNEIIAQTMIFSAILIYADYINITSHLSGLKDFQVLIGILILIMLFSVFFDLIKKLFKINILNICYFDKFIVITLNSSILISLSRLCFDDINYRFLSTLFLVCLILVTVFLIIFRIMLLYHYKPKKESIISIENNVIELEKLYNNDTSSLSLITGNHILVNDEEFEKDLLDYKSFIDSLYNLIIVSNPKKSFKIGLIGPWGSGKSSVVRELQRKLESNEFNNTKIIWFSCWGHLDEKSAIKSLIKDIIDKVEIGYLSSDEKKIYNSYIDKMMSVANNFSPLGLDLSYPYNNDEVISDFEKSVSQNLKNTNSKLLIVIDDLDRVSDKEIDIMFRCVANYFNLKNTIFLMCYDENYVRKIKKESYGMDYFDKVLNMKLYMPIIDKKVISDIFEKSLNNLYEIYVKNSNLNIELEFDNAEVDRFKNSVISRVGSGFSNLREMKNFINIISVYMKESFFGLNAFDFIAIKFLEFKSELLYRKIYQKKDELIRIRELPDFKTRMTRLNNIFSPSDVDEESKREYDKHKGILYFLFAYVETKNDTNESRWYRKPSVDSKLLNKGEYFTKFFSMIASIDVQIDDEETDQSL